MPNQERLRETKHHGAVRFPFNIYPCTIPGDFLQVPLHWHDSMELVYVKKGSGIVQVGVNAYPAEQGDIYIFAPGTLHALHQRGQAVMEYENIIFELELLGGADDLCAERYLLPLQSGRMALQPRIIPGEAGYPQAAACLQETEEANKVKNAGYRSNANGRSRSRRSRRPANTCDSSNETAAGPARAATGYKTYTKKAKVKLTKTYRGQWSENRKAVLPVKILHYRYGQSQSRKHVRGVQRA